MMETGLTLELGSDPRDEQDGCRTCDSRPQKRRCREPAKREGPQNLDDIFAWPEDLWDHLDESHKSAFVGKAHNKQKLIVTTSYSGIGSVEQALGMFFEARVGWSANVKKLCEFLTFRSQRFEQNVCLDFEVHKGVA